ncbi:MAG: M20/M25/M40 family metallo-hydrolase [Chloroflexota bacterium]|nr:M20/M25/M40 family metallo-hydrolase [Chloroflexota bacterium]
MKREKLIEILQSLSDVMSTSGDESLMRQALRPLLAGHVDEMRVDSLGNLITLKKGTGESQLRVLVTAHIDEVGMIIVDHTTDGALKVRAVGGIDDRLLPGLNVCVGKEQLPGVMGVKAIHHSTAPERLRAIPIKDLSVDIGAKDKKEAQHLAPLGTRVTFSTRAHPLGELLAGKAFDDRAGCTALIALLHGEPFPFDLHGVFTVQEEVGLRGARVAGYALEPDVAFVLEGTIADDLPKKEDVSLTSEIGKGPVLTVMDHSYISAPWLLRHTVKLAEELGIPYQFKQPGIGGTDAGAIHLTRGGVPSLTLAVPCRYIHGPISLLKPEDLEATIDLTAAALRNLTAEQLATN